jgi:hypothetical protein
MRTKWEQVLKHKSRNIVDSAAIAVAILLSTAVGAQQRNAAAPASRPTAYDVTRETTLQGTVVSYMEDSSRPPVGAHVTVQTASGTVDVHLGPASYLRSNHFSLAVGDPVRFIGANIPAKQGNVFLARIAQHGTQVIAVRSASGFLLATTTSRALPQAERSQSAQQGKPR